MNEEQKDITPDTFPKYAPNPLLASLPPHLKDQANFDKIQRALLETLVCRKTHSDVVKMAECTKCTENMLVRRKLLKELGFQSVAQYMEWRKVHEVIKKRVPLPKYNS